MRADAGGWLRSLMRRSGEPLIRQAMRRAMIITGGEFVVGRSIEEALARSRSEAPLALCSFDMLGEGARTQREADNYQTAYLHAIAALGAERVGEPLHSRSAISVKLSALEPRFALTHAHTVHRNLTPRALQLVRAAAARDVGVTIDAEEADRLEISLAVIEALARDSTTRDWPGLGLAVQAYGKRAAAVIDWVDELCRATGRRMTVRLVKGAYWDTEIKRAQERGLAGYPVYTRKSTTDICWLACAARLLAKRERIWSQFATHNAHSIAAVLAMAPDARGYEFQRLHGMGALLYDEARRQVASFPPVRAYAPVGEHADLLAYLVRRLIENGANTSFVNRFMDESVPVDELVQDPWAGLSRSRSAAASRHPIAAAVVWRRTRQFARRRFRLAARSAGRAARAGGARRAQLSGRPARWRKRRGDQPGEFAGSPGRGALRFAGRCRARVLARAADAWPAWNLLGVEPRAACLERAADLLQSRRADYLSLLVREAGKTLPDAIAEWREAIDFCRYYAAEARRTLLAPQRLTGPTGETNELTLTGRGVFACISPWNFPLAIFTGQVAAALVAGNAVVAKPAETTSLIGAQMTALLHEAGVPPDGAAVSADARRGFRRGGARAPGVGGRGLHRLHRHGAMAQSRAGVARRRDPAADCRNRRYQRDDRRLHRPAGAGGGRCGHQCFWQRRAALLRVALVMRAGRRRRSDHRDADRRDAGTRYRRSGGSRHRSGAGHFQRRGPQADRLRRARRARGAHPGDRSPGGSGCRGTFRRCRT